MGYQKAIKVSKNSQENNLERITNENDREIPKEIQISPEERKKVINNLDINIIV